MRAEDDKCTGVCFLMKSLMPRTSSKCRLKHAAVDVYIKYNNSSCTDSHSFSVEMKNSVNMQHITTTQRNHQTSVAHETRGHFITKAVAWIHVHDPLHFKHHLPSDIHVSFAQHSSHLQILNLLSLACVSSQHSGIHVGNTWFCRAVQVFGPCYWSLHKWKKADVYLGAGSTSPQGPNCSPEQRFRGHCRSWSQREQQPRHRSTPSPAACRFSTSLAPHPSRTGRSLAF